MAYKTENFAEFLPALQALPNGTYFDINLSGSKLQIQARTRADVLECIQALGIKVAKKEWIEGSQWWEYAGTSSYGIEVEIYACREAPPTCKAIVEEYQVEERVPVISSYETKLVTRQRVRWDCAPERDE